MLVDHKTKITFHEIPMATHHLMNSLSPGTNHTPGEQTKGIRIQSFFQQPLHNFLSPHSGAPPFNAAAPTSNPASCLHAPTVAVIARPTLPGLTSMQPTMAHLERLVERLQGCHTDLHASHCYKTTVLNESTSQTVISMHV